MKRIVKFRGKRKDTGIWVYGSYHPHKDVMLCIASKEQHEENNKALIVQDGMSDWNLSVPINAYEVFPEFVGEFIGLLDKNGKEIYEGDVCTFYNPYSEKTYTRVVRYCPLFACFGLYINMETVYEYESDWVKIQNIEVIGNIFENPELLKP